MCLYVTWGHCWKMTLAFGGEAEHTVESEDHMEVNGPSFCVCLSSNLYCILLCCILCSPLPVTKVCIPSLFESLWAKLTHNI